MKDTELKNITALDEIAAIISGNDSPKAMMNRLDDYHGSDIAEVICTLNVQNRKKFYRVCSLEMLAEIFEYLEEKQAGEYLSEMDIHKAAELIAELDTDTAVNILAETDKNRRSLILEAVEPAIRTELRLIASFDDEMGEDYAKLGGLSAEEDLNEPVLASVKKRLPWLLILLGLGMVVSRAVACCNYPCSCGSLLRHELDIPAERPPSFIKIHAKKDPHCKKYWSILYVKGL